MAGLKPTAALMRVLGVFLADTSARHYGYDLMKAAGLASGTLYPMLARLEEEGLAFSEWEPAGAGGRPPRKYYQLTGEGVRVARLELAGTAASAATAASHSAPRAVRPAPGGAAGGRLRRPLPDRPRPGRAGALSAKMGLAAVCLASIPLGGIVYLSIGRARPQQPASQQPAHSP